jgi:hypothetical protein
VAVATEDLFGLFLTETTATAKIEVSFGMGAPPAPSTDEVAVLSGRRRSALTSW